jgi:hypothetical protein
MNYFNIDVELIESMYLVYLVGRLFYNIWSSVKFKQNVVKSIFF